MGVHPISERVELAKLCSTRDWSKAIRVLDSLLSQSCVIQDLCNRAFCYSQLELHKHVIKDCDKRHFSLILPFSKLTFSRNKVTDMLSAQSTDLKQLLELEELLASSKRTKPKTLLWRHVFKLRLYLIQGPEIQCKAIKTSQNEIKSTDSSQICSKPNDMSKTLKESSGASELCNKTNGTSEMHGKSSVSSENFITSNCSSEVNNKSSGASEICSKANGTPETHTTYQVQHLKCAGNQVICLIYLAKKRDETKKNVKFFSTGMLKTKSISLDFRLSRGITQHQNAFNLMNEGKYHVSLFPGIVGRAFQRELDAAIVDFTSVLDQGIRICPNSSDILHERGIVNYKFKDYKAAVHDLSSCVKLDKDNKSAYTYLGLALASIGEYGQAEEAHAKSIEFDKLYLEGWIHLAQLYQELAKPTKAFECLEQVLQTDGSISPLVWLLHHGLGEHKNAIKDLTMGLSIESSNIECLYLRASCYHAVAEYGNAVKDYDAVLDLELDSVEKFVLQCLAFYQKELALYTASKATSEFCWFDIDGDIDPYLRRHWKEDQYNCPGFLPNRRQHRMAGLAAIEIAQKVSRAWRSVHTEWKFSSKGITKNSKKARRKERNYVPSQNRVVLVVVPRNHQVSSTMSWQDVYSMAVKWRQISEPCDPVVWVNKLSEEFNAGFGSHTPPNSWTGKSCRYYPNYQRYDNISRLLHAETCSDLYSVTGEDFWIATWCNSTAFEGKRLEGTRVTLQKITPCMPSRWEHFDEEMTMAWEVSIAMYNFMPLSRGSAVVGYIVLLGLFLAANMEIRESIPDGVQVDWEAILTSDPNTFVNSLKRWLCPSLKINTRKDIPDVASTLGTTGSVIAALSTYTE
ncbi:hypothetical protein MKW92_015947 [Papaver armeniacum]|nr:hypothetical protein MKW92_015947 [Papaver armeniacum]